METTREYCEERCKTRCLSRCEGAAEHLAITAQRKLDNQKYRALYLQIMGYVPGPCHKCYDMRCIYRCVRTYGG